MRKHLCYLKNRNRCSNGVQAQKPILPIDELGGGGASETDEKGGAIKGHSLILWREEKDGPVLSGLAPVGPVHLQHLLHAEAQTLQGKKKWEEPVMRFSSRGRWRGSLEASTPAPSRKQTACSAIQ